MPKHVLFKKIKPHNMYLVYLIVLLTNIPQSNDDFLLSEYKSMKHNLNNSNYVSNSYNYNKTLMRQSIDKNMDNQLVEIDGSVLEGGGQIIRISLSLSALMQTPIKITKIRAGRDRPGLMEQHLKGLELMQQLTRADVRGAVKGSTVIEFYPGVMQTGHFKSQIKTAGSLALVLQVALPCCIFAPASIELSLQGGTNVDKAPQVDYMTEIFRPNLEKMGATFDFELVKRGYFPRGGGHVQIGVHPVEELKPIVMEQMGDIVAIYGWSFASGRMHIKEAEDMAKAAEEEIKAFGVKVAIEVYREEKAVAPIGDCAGIILVAETSTGCYLGASGLKSRNDDSATVGRTAAKELAETLRRKVCVDDHTQDQLIIFMALANGQSRLKVGNVTLHTKTAIHIAEQLTTAKFTIKDYSEYSIIECIGIGYKQTY